MFHAQTYRKPGRCEPNEEIVRVVQTRPRAHPKQLAGRCDGAETNTHFVSVQCGLQGQRERERELVRKNGQKRNWPQFSDLRFRRSILEIRHGAKQQRGMAGYRRRGGA